MLAAAYDYNPIASASGLLSALFSEESCENTRFPGFSGGFCPTSTDSVCIKDSVWIDPCMGSGHILCYFFDVLMQIYESQGYSQRDAAQSILENNIYGLDIDERAYQLSYFAVMMKARQYDRRILSRGIQPHVYAIVESNGINCSHLSKFGATLDELQRNNAMNQINGLIDVLYDAKEYGSILSVDNLDWELLREFTGEYSLTGQMSLEEIGIEETQKQLQELICVGEVLAKKYHIVATNPPYMASTNLGVKTSKYIKEYFFDSKSDLYSVFIEVCSTMMQKNGYQAMITQHGWMFLVSFEKLRKKMLQKDIVNMAHLGARAFEEISGEVVQTTAFIRRCSRVYGYKSRYCRLVDFAAQSLKEKEFLSGDYRYVVSQDDYQFIPGSPIAYWVSNNFVKSFQQYPPLDNFVECAAGISTGDNERYLKLWPEVAFNKIAKDISDEESFQDSKYIYAYCNKGGKFRKWYGNNDYVAAWRSSQEFHRNGATYKHLFFKEGITWNEICLGNFNARYYPNGLIFDHKSPGMFNSSPLKLRAYLGLLNSKVVSYILGVINPTISTGADSLRKIPVAMKEENFAPVSKIVDACVKISKEEWDSFETSWEFKDHPLVKYRHSVSKTMVDPDWSNQSWYIKNAYEAWEYQCQLRFDTLKINEEELNRIFIKAYGLQDELTPTVEEKDVTVRQADLQRDIKSLISYAVGCMFGRFSHYMDGLLYAGGHWDYGTIVERISDAAKKSESENWLPSEVFVPDRDAVIPITDEEYFEDDIVGLFCAWLKKVYGAETLEENLDFIAQALGNKGNSSREVLRNYFLKDFFKDHCDTYSVTGSGKRPIYWLYSSGNQNGFKALVYMHRYDVDTTGRVRADYLQRMVRVYENEISRMEEVIESSDNNREVANATKRREKLQKQLKECRDYDEKIAPLALSRINIDLDDGVKVNYRKVQTDNRGKFHEILADSSAIMSKEK